MKRKQEISILSKREQQESKELLFSPTWKRDNRKKPNDMSEKATSASLAGTDGMMVLRK